MTGASAAAKGSREATPIKTDEVARKPATKIVQGDWLWMGSRELKTTKGLWHNYKGKRSCNMLFGDSHVETYRFPANMDALFSAPINIIDGRWW